VWLPLVFGPSRAIAAVFREPAELALVLGVLAEGSDTAALLGADLPPASARREDRHVAARKNLQRLVDLLVPIELFWICASLSAVLLLMT
jgi:hypothetical protein